MRLLLAMSLAALTSVSGCIPSNVVARDDRIVIDNVDELIFVPASGLQLEGLYGSVAITGDAALSMRQVYYYFLPDGAYTAAALIDDGEALAFQTLSGTFHVEARGLVLDDGEPVQLEQAPEHIRITAPDGGLVLRRERQQ